ncbi:hypothetical protein LRAMOSA03421 [Lichtheimia ramosa]|uniref:SNARE-complex protein Syntaxin-18 N-terminal domain-containing protein n=1 Tax=Lichtheimia ramosa TaxID=688394 RepID=A0A077WVY0_9FUNG|nr:hypothetical protein LRAMOSA03421 [Lichtheimia ramosa]
MPDRTAEFRTIAHEKSSLRPASSPKRKIKKELDNDASYDLFTKEAYRIHEHIDSLRRFLLSIRRAYLNTDTRQSLRKRPGTPTTAAVPKASGLEGSLFALFGTDIGTLTDNERDEIDFQAKVIIRRCMDRIKELEHAEQVRKEQELTASSKGIAGFLGSLLVSSESTLARDTLALHRSSMIWLLNKQLAKVSELQKSQQEIRLQRALEKSENQLHRSSEMALSAQSLVDEDIQYNNHEQEEMPMDAFQEQLSQEQLQVLERENSTMIEELNNTLNQVRNAETALLEISTLQNQLTEHLAAQTVQTDQLYADSIATTERIEQGNLQLIKTKERNRGTRNFTLIFLLFASFILLFLDWYS